MKGIRKIQLIFLTALFIAVIPLSVFGVDGQIEIGQTPSTIFPILIDQPGNYVLTSNFIVSAPDTDCLHVHADDVILDLQNHTITGPGEGNGRGIYVVQGNNIAVLNGTVHGFFNGLVLSGAHHKVKNIQASDNRDHGIKAEFSVIADCVASGNGSSGIDAASCNISDCTANNNGCHGLAANSSSITNCTANGNSIHGIYTTDKCRLEGCTMEENGGCGLYLSPDFSYAIKNKSSGNTGGNFFLDGLHYFPTSGDEANREL